MGLGERTRESCGAPVFGRSNADETDRDGEYHGCRHGWMLLRLKTGAHRFSNASVWILSPLGTDPFVPFSLKEN